MWNSTINVFEKCSVPIFPIVQCIFWIFIEWGYRLNKTTVVMIRNFQILINAERNDFDILQWKSSNNSRWTVMIQLESSQLQSIGRINYPKHRLKFDWKFSNNKNRLTIDKQLEILFVRKRDCKPCEFRNRTSFDLFRTIFIELCHSISNKKINSLCQWPAEIQLILTIAKQIETNII